MSFITVTGFRGESVYINAAKILRIETPTQEAKDEAAKANPGADRTNSLVVLENGFSPATLGVVETPEQILSQIT